MTARLIRPRLRLAAVLAASAVTVGLLAVPAYAAQILSSTTAIELIEGDVGSPGASVTYDVVLDAGPASPVTIAVSAPSAHVSVSPGSLVFTGANWGTPQTVTVSPVNDNNPESRQTVTIHHHASSADPAFAGLDRHVLATIIDDDGPAYIDLSHSGADTTVTENGAGDHYLMRLTARPTANVTVTIDPRGDVSVPVSSVTFTPDNFSSFVGIPVSAIDDLHTEQTETALIMHTASSSDSRYNGGHMFNPDDGFLVTVRDNDRHPTILLPTADICIASSSVKFAGLGGRYQNLTVIVDGDAEALATVADDETWSTTAILDDGIRSAVVKDGDGRVSAPVSFEVDSVAPTTPVITNPAGGATVGATVTVTGTADPGALVVLTDGADAQLGTATASPGGTWSIDVTYGASGPQTLKASTTDCGVTSASAPVSFTVDAEAPAMTVRTAGGAHIAPGRSLTVEGIASDRYGVARVTVVVRNALGQTSPAAVQCAACPASNVTWSASMDALPGPYTVTITAVDVNGNSATEEITILKV